MSNRHSENDFAHRRSLFEETYVNLPCDKSPQFWLTVRQEQFPLEVLVRLFRDAVRSGDLLSRDRFFEIIYIRIKKFNARWVQKRICIPGVFCIEPWELIKDFCSALSCSLFMSLINLERIRWEECFSSCLEYERRHVLNWLFINEGWKRPRGAKRDYRLRRVYLDQEHIDEGGSPVDVLELIQDEQAAHMLLFIEIHQLIARLPERLKVIVQLIYWDEWNRKDIAALLNISERTVYNCLQSALASLASWLENDHAHVALS